MTIKWVVSKCDRVFCVSNAIWAATTQSRPTDRISKAEKLPRISSNPFLAMQPKLSPFYRKTYFLTVFKKSLICFEFLLDAYLEPPILMSGSPINGRPPGFPPNPRDIGGM